MADGPTFASGDIVQLKSGGPPMTVAWTSADEVGCHWWSEAASKFEFNRFAPLQLEPVDD